MSVNAVRAWERNDRKLSRMASRFLDEIVLSPDHWKARIRESIVTKGQDDNPRDGKPADLFDDQRIPSQAVPVPTGTACFLLGSGWRWGFAAAASRSLPPQTHLAAAGRG